MGVSADIQEFLRNHGLLNRLGEHDWPRADGREHPRKMFAGNVHVLLRLISRSLDCHATEDFYHLWDFIIRGLPSHEINQIQEDGSTLLSSMLFFAQDHYYGDLMDNQFATIVTKFVQRPDLCSSVITSIGPGFAMQGRVPTLWLCLRGKQPCKNGRSCYSGNRRILEDVALAMIESSALSEETLD